MIDSASDVIPSAGAALASFSFVTSITPGPNNLMLMTSGAHNGFKATIPHMAGVSCGMAGLMTAAYFGIASIAAEHPESRLVMTWLCALYMGWLASKLLRDRRCDGAPHQELHSRPLSLSQAASFQLLNPKGLAMALTAATTVLAANLDWPAGITLLVTVFTIVNVPCLALWTFAGAAIRRFLEQPRIKMAFDLLMAALLLATAVAMVWGAKLS